MIKTLSFEQHPAFLKAQELARSALCTHFGKDWPEVVELLSDGNSVDLRENFELMVQIENCMMELLAQCDLPPIKSVQFPVNLRMSHVAPPKGYLDRPFATDYVHCDVWSDAPTDSLNVFLYLFIFGDSSYLKVFPSIESDPYARDYRGPYSGFKGDLSRLQEVPLERGVGIMHAFSTYCPHKTVRGTNGLRISIDFRIRTDVPYRIDGAPIDRVKFSSYSPGVPGPGYYWTKPERPLRDFADKCDFEKSQARTLGPWAESLREDYIRKISNTGVFA